jgi:hypothetical protein
VDPLGFKFDVEAVVAGGVAHRVDCDLLLAEGPSRDAVELGVGGIYRSQRCPRGCPRCAPPFVTMLGAELSP